MTDSDSHPRVEINLLGEFVLRTGAISTSQPWSTRVQALVAYLLLHRAAAQARTQIAFVFWPDTTSQQAFTNLRQLLHHLRRVWPDAEHFLHITPKTIQWRMDAPFTLDVADFEAHLARAAQDSAPTARRAALAEAIDLYRGDLFPTCYEEWILPQREQLRTAFGRALEDLILLLEGQTDYPAAIAYAQRLVQHDPLHEVAYRHLMRLHAANHDRAAALRVYHVCATLLERELDAPPHPATQSLYQQLLQDTMTTVAPPPLPPVQPGQARLVGRQAEWRQLQRIWQEVVQGRTHCVLIAGEAGIGKTRLAEELLHWVSQQGVAALSARAYAAEGALAYAPICEWFRSPVIRGGLARLADHWLLEIARLLPEVLTIRPHLQQPDGGRMAQDASGQRIRLFEALARGVLVSAQPILILLDDLQWCDAETLEWLHYFLRFDTQARCLLLVTVRPEDTEPDHPLNHFLGSMRTLDRFYALDLKALAADEAAILANQTAGHPLDAQIVAQLYQISNGNPLFVVEGARAIIRPDKGTVERDASILTKGDISTFDLNAVTLPPKIQSLIQQRLTHLSPGARDLLEVAAVFGRSFPVDLLLAATQQREDALVQGMDELWRRRLVREQGASAYDFSHDYIREVAYATLSPARRRLLHRRVAEGLESYYGLSLDSISGQLGLHLERAGLPAAAIPRYRQAGVHARRLFAYQEGGTKRIVR